MNDNQSTNEGPVLRSPNEMLSAAKRIMLEGRDPETREDWIKVVNFWAVNVAPEVALSAVPLMCKLYDVPLSDEEVETIVMLQLLPPEVAELVSVFTKFQIADKE